MIVRLLRHYAALLLLVAPAALLGCDYRNISGKVLDVQGETLPGVAVHVEGTDYEALTNPLGEYTVAYRPGPVVLDFVKTGYTPGRLEVKSDAFVDIQATEVSLWRLPDSWGVYFVESARYQAITAVEPKMYTAASGQIVFGITKQPEQNTTNSAPFIVCHKLPRNDVHLCRMVRSELDVVEPGQGAVKGPSRKIAVWTPGASLPASADPIDEPEGVLLRLQYGETLTPGCYAVHWGALEGYTDLDKRAFLFEVTDPNAPPPAPLAETPKADKPKTDSMKKAPETGDGDDSPGY